MATVGQYQGCSEASYANKAVIGLDGDYQLVLASYGDVPACVRIKRREEQSAVFRVFVPVVGVGSSTDRPVVPLITSAGAWAQVAADAAAYMVVRLRLRKGEIIESTLAIEAVEYCGDGILVDIGLGRRL